MTNDREYLRRIEEEFARAVGGTVIEIGGHFYTTTDNPGVMFPGAVYAPPDIGIPDDR